MLSNEERKRLVETYKKFPDAVNSSSVYRLVRQMKDEGSVDLKVGNRGRKPSLHRLVFWDESGANTRRYGRAFGKDCVPLNKPKSFFHAFGGFRRFRRNDGKKG